MSDHILHKIREAKREKVSELNEMPTLAYYKAGVDLAEWGRLLDLRDLSYIDTCMTWERLIEAFSKMEGKYKRLWELAGKPDDFESWNRVLDYTKDYSVGKAYWDTLNEEVQYGWVLKEVKKEVFA